jgi:hypothetical protein
MWKLSSCIEDMYLGISLENGDRDMRITKENKS